MHRKSSHIRLPGVVGRYVYYEEGHEPGPEDIQRSEILEGRMREGFVRIRQLMVRMTTPAHLGTSQLQGFLPITTPPLPIPRNRLEASELRELAFNSTTLALAAVS